MSSPVQSDIEGDLPAAATEQGMLDRKELSAFAFQRTRMPMVVSDARQEDYPIVLANDAFLNLTGYTAEDLLGKNCRILQGEATSQTAVAQIRAAIARQRDLTIEILNYKKDGTPFWNQLHLSAIHDEHGELAYYFASQIDVTDYRRIQTLEEAEHRLLLEVDHRTKNVLAVVDSIVRLSRSDNAASYAASVQQRVQALSRTHMLLAEKAGRRWSSPKLSARKSRFLATVASRSMGRLSWFPLLPRNPSVWRSMNSPPTQLFMEHSLSATADYGSVGLRMRLA